MQWLYQRVTLQIARAGGCVRSGGEQCGQWAEPPTGGVGHQRQEAAHARRSGMGWSAQAYLCQNLTYVALLVYVKFFPNLRTSELSIKSLLNNV